MKKIEFTNLIREFPGRSIQWLLETPDNFHGLLNVLASDLASQIDYKQIKNLNRTFILDDFRKREADLVFEAPFADKDSPHEVIIYILIEHQSTIDPTIPFRLLFYMTQIWDMQRREWENKNLSLHQWKFYPILPIVFYTGSQRWELPSGIHQLMDLPDSLEKFIPHHETLYLDLKTVKPEELTTDDHPFGWVLRVIQKEDATREEFEQVLHFAIQHLEKMRPEEKVNWEKLMHFLFAFISHRRKQSEQSELFDVIKNTISEKSHQKEVENMEKTIAQALMEEGKKEGLCDAVSLGLELKFGDDGIALMNKVRKLKSIEKLEEIIRTIRSAKKIDEIKKLIR
jgi:hypothetical protein